MSINDPDQFSEWLDDFVSGGNPPIKGHPRTREVEQAAVEFHRLASRSNDQVRQPLKNSSWDQYISAFPEISATGTSRPPASRKKEARSNFTGSTADRILASVLAACMVLALGAGMWRISGELPFGGRGNPPATLPFGSNSPGYGSIDPAELPTAADCTIEPLTIDEVIWYIREPGIAFHSSSMDVPGTLPAEVPMATPPATNPPTYEPQPAPQQELLAASETQRMYIACAMANSYFQLWATMSPYLVSHTIQASLPALTSEEELRSMLVDLEKNGPQPAASDSTPYVRSPFPPLPETIPLRGVQVLDTNPSNSWKQWETVLAVAYVTYETNGDVMYQPISIFRLNDGTYATPSTDHQIELERPRCGVYLFTWNEIRSRWLIDTLPSCG